MRSEWFLFSCWGFGDEKLFAALFAFFPFNRVAAISMGSITKYNAFEFVKV